MKRKEKKIIIFGVILLALGLIFSWWLKKPKLTENQPTPIPTVDAEPTNMTEALAGLEVFENENKVLILNAQQEFYFNENLQSVDETTEGEIITGTWEETNNEIKLTFNSGEERIFTRQADGNLIFENEILKKVTDLLERTVDLETTN